MHHGAKLHGLNAYQFIDSFEVAATSGDGTPATAVYPVGIRSGDLIFYLQYLANSGSVPTKVIPSGCTEIHDVTVAFTRLTLAYKLATGAESGTNVNGGAGDSWEYGVCIVLRGSVPVKTASLHAHVGVASATDPAAQTITPPAPGLTAEIMVAAMGSDGVGFSSVDTPAFESSKSFTVSSFIYLKFNTYGLGRPAAAQTIDMADHGTTNMLILGYLGVKA